MGEGAGAGGQESAYLETPVRAYPYVHRAFPAYRRKCESTQFPSREPSDQLDGGINRQRIEADLVRRQHVLRDLGRADLVHETAHALVLLEFLEEIVALLGRQHLGVCESRFLRSDSMDRGQQATPYTHRPQHGASTGLVCDVPVVICQNGARRRGRRRRQRSCRAGSTAEFQNLDTHRCP